MRYRISFLNNHLESDSIGVILVQLESMVSKIQVEFIDKELNKKVIINNIRDYKRLCKEY